MCQYYYIYRSTCQHADFYRVSYCDKAKSLVGSSTNDGHSPDKPTAVKSSGLPYSFSSPQPPTSSASNRRYSHSHNQQQSTHNMSALTQPEAGTVLSQDNTLVLDAERLPHPTTLIPRSALEEAVCSTQDEGSTHANSLLGAGNSCSLNIDVPLENSSSVTMELAHDVTCDAATLPPSATTRRGSISTTNTSPRQRSARMPLPSQWTATSNGPNLATAQRAKQREHQKDSIGAFPVEAKVIRGARSSATLGRHHGGTEGPTFLTKEALACVEGNITSPTSSPRSPTKNQRPAWRSPTTSPLHESARQNTTLRIKLSPTKLTYLTTEASSSIHSRGPSSVATSTGDTIYHDTEGSPVRSTADSEQSFQSAAEAFDDEKNDVPLFESDADQDAQQVAHVLGHKTSISKASITGRAIATKPRLAVHIPPHELRFESASPSSAPTTSATSSSGVTMSPASPQSAPLVSKIPRVAANTMRSARDETRSSILKKAQSTKSLTSMAKKQMLLQGQAQTLQSDTPPAVPVCHVRTLDSSNATPIISRRATNEDFTSFIESSDGTILGNSQQSRDTSSSLVKSDIHNLPCPRLEHPDDSGSRASSSCTVKISSGTADPAMMDSAIIYSRRKSDASGMEPHPSLPIPTVIVMMAHTLDIGTLSSSHSSHDKPSSATQSHAIYKASEVSAPVVQVDAGGISARDQEDSTLSFTLPSDLRATAAEFVPQTTQTASMGNPETPPTELQVTPITDLLGSQAYALDMYGIPWLYYMNQVQFAYNQGFHNGRAKSPKKPKRAKKCFSSTPTSVGLDDSDKEPATPSAVPDVSEKTPTQSRSVSHMPPPQSTVPLAQQRAQAQAQQENTKLSVAGPRLNDNASDVPSSDPFASQLDFVSRHAALQNITNSDQNSNFDLTSIHNVNTTGGARVSNTQNHAGYSHTMHPRRQGHNSNRRHHYRSDNGLYSYGGRGNVGIPIDTVPFPDPVAPQGRPQGAAEQSQGAVGQSERQQYLGYSVPVGKDACGLVDIVFAAENMGGQTCNGCAPDHPIQ